MTTTWRVRGAHPDDLPAIKELVASVGGDLDDLQAGQFVVALGPEQRIIGCGRLKPYSGFDELASIAVKEEWRASGVGRAVVGQLLKSHQGPVYLICEDDAVDFFRRFGFYLIPISQMVPGLQPKLDRYAAEVGHINIMRRD